MNLTEVDSRKILKELGIPVKTAYLVSAPEEAEIIARKINSRVVIKVEIGLGSRGKAGGVKLCYPDEILKISKELFGKIIRGVPVKKCLIAPAVEIKKEMYLSIMLDTEKKIPVILASKSGGSDIEEISENNPSAILKTSVPVSLDISKSVIENIFKFLELPKNMFVSFEKIIQGLIKGFWKFHATLIELNPLVIDKNDKLIAVDAKVKIDDYKTDTVKQTGCDVEDSLTEIEKIAKKCGLSYVQLDGDIGCIVNGAGLAMATVDAISEYGMNPANLLDVGGSSNPQKMVDAINLITRNSKVKTIFINIFGGITRCTDIADGLITSLKSTKNNVKLVVHLSGTASVDARNILKKNRIECFSSMKNALEHLSGVCR